VFSALSVEFRLTLTQPNIAEFFAVSIPGTTKPPRLVFVPLRDSVHTLLAT
jgi:hypothetical protein